MSFLPPPVAGDVHGDCGPYSRDEIIAARACLLDTVQRQHSSVWNGLKAKMGILPNGQRLRVSDPERVWIPAQLPRLWSAPVVLYDGAQAAGGRRLGGRLGGRGGGERGGPSGAVPRATFDFSTWMSSGSPGRHDNRGREAKPGSVQTQSSGQQPVAAASRSGLKRSWRDRDEQLPTNPQHAVTAISSVTNASKRQKCTTSTGGAAQRGKDSDEGPGCNTPRRQGLSSAQTPQRNYPASAITTVTNANKRHEKSTVTVASAAGGTAERRRESAEGRDSPTSRREGHSSVHTPDRKYATAISTVTSASKRQKSTTLTSPGAADRGRESFEGPGSYTPRRRGPSSAQSVPQRRHHVTTATTTSRPCPIPTLTHSRPSFQPYQQMRWWRT